MREDRTPPERLGERRLTVSDAAQELGISAEAVRSRIKRGSLDSTKEGSTVYVLLPGRPDSDQTSAGHDRTNDQTPPEHDQGRGTRADAHHELVESLIEQVAYMREQLAEEREARRRADTIIAQLTQANATLARRVPELEASPEATGAPEKASEGAGSDIPEERQEPSQRRSWWREFFGLE
jgi:predicted ArsR family transcriptional regulator